MTPKLFKGIADFTDAYDFFLIDIWGVLHDGNNAYPGAADAMRYLQSKGKTALLLSNSPNRASRVVEKVLNPIGIPADTYQYIMTSGEAAHDYMAQHHAGQNVYTFWDDENPTALEHLDINRVYDINEADFIYASLIPYNAQSDTYDAVLKAAHARDIPFICGNPDRVVVNGGTLHLCVGSLAEAYENAGGRVVWFGKPFRPIYDQAWETLGKPDKSKILAIGDGLLTDVGGANTFGCDVVWNVEGIHWDEVSLNDHIDPDKLKTVLKGQPQPIGLIHGFNI
jgi:HAD superfamily hydrolase (TIGR01459 family)